MPRTATRAGTFRSLVTAAINKHIRWGNDRIADEIANSTDDIEELRGWIAEIGPAIVADIRRNHRNAALNAPSLQAVKSDGRDRHAIKGASRGASLRQEVSRNTDWKRLLHQNVSTSTGVKRIGLLSLADIDYVLASRESHIADVREQMRKMQLIRNAIAAAGVSCADELDQPVTF
jgi:hypothetical protein